MSPLVLCCRILRAAASGETIPERAVDSGPQTAGADSPRFAPPHFAPPPPRFARGKRFARGRRGSRDMRFTRNDKKGFLPQRSQGR